jgi:FixJ family two-component response regulator
MGLAAFAERARTELVATGATVRTRSVEAFAALTPREGQIARLARDGLSNSEIGSRVFLSARTVEWHLRKVSGSSTTSSGRRRPVKPGDVAGKSVAGARGPQSPEELAKTNTRTA